MTSDDIAIYQPSGNVTVNGGTVGHYTSDDDCSYMGIQVMDGTNAVVEVTNGKVSGLDALYSNGTGSSLCFCRLESSSKVGIPSG